jgi:hypothetical protein
MGSTQIHPQWSHPRRGIIDYWSSIKLSLYIDGICFWNPGFWNHGADMHATDSSGTRLEYFWPVEEQTLFCVLFVCLFVCLCRFKLLPKLERVVDSSNSRASCTLPKSGALNIKAIFG